MRLGIDFGTTHTVVALVDRGNYPVVSFEGEEFVPSLVAGDATGALRFGADAAAVRHDEAWSLLRSWKRLLNEAGPATAVELAGRRHRLVDLFAGFLAHVRDALVARSNAGLAAGEALEAAVSVPANAPSAQRFLTIDAFRRAGFSVVTLLNEPSAAGFEYAHRYRATITGKREHVAIYDLGGGTFDASLVRMTGRANEVTRSEGIQRLGGDDFDEAILDLVLSRLGDPDVPAETRALLLEECARQKEAVHPSTRRLLLDLTPLEKAPLALPIEDVYAACAPLVARTLDGLARVLGEDAAGVEAAELAGVYVVGGAGSFPLVARLLRERYGERRVKRSPHPFAATAIGLAVVLDREAGYTLSDRLSRTFGVFRESASGGSVVFDPIFGADTELPRADGPPVTTTRRYRAAHNVGHFRFVEASRIVDGRPDGDVLPWDELRFPFDRRLRDRASLDAEPVLRTNGAGPEVEEVYAVVAGGGVEVTLTDLSDGFARTFRLARSGARETPAAASPPRKGSQKKRG